MDQISDVALGEICSYLDFRSANLLCTSVSKRITAILEHQHHLWESFHKRLGFISDLDRKKSFLRETVKRFRYSQALLQPSSSKRARSCCAEPFCIPSTAVSFVPLRNEAWTDSALEEDDDLRLMWICEDALSLLGGTGSTLIMMNPWTHQLALHSSLIESAKVLDDEVVTTFLKNSDHWKRPQEEQERGMMETSSILLDSSPGALDLASYFCQTRYSDLEVEVLFLGLEVRPRLNPQNWTVDGYDLSCVRSIESTNLDTPISIVEIFSWFIDRQSAQPINVRSVRFFDSRFWTMAVCGRQRLLYVNAYDRPCGATSIQVYSLPDTSCPLPIYGATAMSCSTKLVGQIEVGEKVNAIELCATSERMIVCTRNSNAIQIWNVKNVEESFLEHTFRLPDVLARIKRELGLTSLALDAVSESLVYQVFVSDHLSLDMGGFITLHFERGSRSSILVWRNNKEISEDCSESISCRVMSMIDLPITSSRKPRVHFDGRHIIVLSKDHIGFLILIYHVRMSGEDDLYFSPHLKTGSPADGNVYNFSSTPSARFVKRVRHAVLGGLRNWESLQMTCNERYIVFNTRRSDTNKKEGLVVIDLEMASD